MNQELKVKWIAALRSGEYQQCTGELINSDGMCCLGVLHKVVTGFIPSSPRWGEANHNQMPRVIENELSNDTRDLLANKNDTGHTFDMIADYIEENL